MRHRLIGASGVPEKKTFNPRLARVQVHRHVRSPRTPRYGRPFLHAPQQAQRSSRPLRYQISEA